jgi:hypothetical protein
MGDRPADHLEHSPAQGSVIGLVGVKPGDRVLEA